MKVRVVGSNKVSVVKLEALRVKLKESGLPPYEVIYEPIEKLYTKRDLSDHPYINCVCMDEDDVYLPGSIENDLKVMIALAKKVGLKTELVNDQDYILGHSYSILLS